MQNQIQVSEESDRLAVVMLDQTEQVQIDGGYGGNDGGCIPGPGPRGPIWPFPIDISF